MDDARATAARVVVCFRIAQQIDDFIPLAKWNADQLLFLAEEGFTGPDLGLLDVTIQIARSIEELKGDVSLNQHQLSRVSTPLLAGDLALALAEVRKFKRR